MPLSDKQKSWIRRKHSKLSAEEMAASLKVSAEEIRKYLDSDALRPVNKLFYIVFLLIPVLFFVLLEMGLRIFNYGYDYTQWMSPTKGTLVLNTDLGHKYFYNMQNVPYSDVDVFDKVKKANAFRVFVLGGSAAAGFPFMPNGSFSRYLQQRLSLEYPGSKIEVVNCAMTAVNSYTLRDLMPGILREKPDLILIYAGHNEYYGALGVGSMESFGTSRQLVNFVIYLEQFRTFQLLRNVISWGAHLLEKPKRETGTLMARMAKNQYIALDSRVYWRGIDQFKGNMTDVLRMAKEKHVPVILGSLTCNLKDQYPFVSISQKNFPPADTVFTEAKKALRLREYRAADSLFRFAKDLDALRFRAPSEINTVIYRLGKKFGDPVVNVDSAFDALSPDHIVGDNLMTDHLHPTLRGYEIMGRLYYDEMEKTGHLPDTRARDLTNRRQDSVTVADFPFARLDSVIGKYRIEVLKNDWPYIKKGSIKPIYEVLAPKNRIDSIAYDLVEGRTDWLTAHTEAANWYLAKNDFSAFIKVMDVIIGQYPRSTQYYDQTAKILISRKDYARAYSYLVKRNDIEPGAFSEKWIGQIDFKEGRIQSAKKHLTASLKFDAKDPQVWYNLTGIYLDEKNYAMALDAIDKTIALNPGFPGARALQAELKKAAR